MRTTGLWIVVGMVLVMLSVTVLRRATPPENNQGKVEAAAGAAHAASDGAMESTAPSRVRTLPPRPAGTTSRYQDHVPKPPFATAEEFDVAYAKAEAGDWQAVSVVTKVADECSYTLYSYPNKNDPPKVSSLDEPTLLAAEHTRRRIAFCHTLDRRKIDQRYALVWRAALTGDRRSVLELSYHWPSGPNASREIPEWKTDVLRLLGQLGNDADALTKLGDIYMKGELVDRDLAKALAYYEKVLEVADPRSRAYAMAKLWVRQLSPPTQSEQK